VDEDPICESSILVREPRFGMQVRRASLEGAFAVVDRLQRFGTNFLPPLEPTLGCQIRMSQHRPTCVPSCRFDACPFGGRYRSDPLNRGYYCDLPTIGKHHERETVQRFPANYGRSPGFGLFARKPPPSTLLFSARAGRITRFVASVPFTLKAVLRQEEVSASDLIPDPSTTRGRREIHRPRHRCTKL